MRALLDVNVLIALLDPGRGSESASFGLFPRLDASSARRERESPLRRESQAACTDRGEITKINRRCDCGDSVLCGCALREANDLPMSSPYVASHAPSQSSRYVPC